MLLDDKQAMLNDLLMTYRESSDHYTDASEQLDDAALGETFAEIAASREAPIERLCELVREAGGLPREPHAEREHARQLLTRLKGALGGDRRRVVLEERIADEKRISTLIGEALELDFSSADRNWFQGLREHQREVLVRLAEALERG